jgi:hypothetical protein
MVQWRKKQWKSRMKRDILLVKEIIESGLQGGEVIWDLLSFLAYIIGISLLIIGIYTIFYMLFGFRFPKMTEIILVLLFNVICIINCLVVDF